jgi:hypothetical protein
MLEINSDSLDISGSYYCFLFNDIFIYASIIDPVGSPLLLSLSQSFSSSTLLNEQLQQHGGHHRQKYLFQGFLPLERCLFGMSEANDGRNK